MTRVRQTTPLLVASILLLAFAPLAQAQPASSASPIAETPDGRPLYQWNPNESWPGGSQYDARLDKPVHFWRAGLALSEVFDSVAEQTGATLRFFPEGDENARVRVNLYLNPAQPPSLRDLMAQLAWVTDCAFAYAQADAGEPGPAYYLLSTSIGQAVPLAPAVLEQRAEQRSRLAEQPAPYRTDMDREAAIKASLKKLRQALALPREELIARYKGIDDYLLYTLTADPRWPAAAEYVCGTIDEAREPTPGREDILSSTRKWADLTEHERALVSHGLHLRKSDLDLIAAAPEAEVRIDCLWDALDLTVSARMGGGTWLGVGAFWTPYFAPTPGRALLEMDRWQPRTVAHFLRSLGEEVPEEDEQVVAGRWKAAVSKKRRHQELAALAKSALSPATADLLGPLTLPVEAGRPYALWELQHAIATTSGLNVVSDCFWQPTRPLYDTDSALIALASAARAWSKQATELREVEWMAGWEWGDAGSFLHFRSIDRDVWRASILPADILAQVDEYLSPYLPEVAEPEWPPTGFSLQLTQDPLALIRIGSSLDDLQLSYGGRLLYEDPAEPAAAARYALRSSFLGCLVNTFGHRPSDALNATRALEAFRLIASLSEGQWARARTPGGLPGDQLTPEQLDRASRAVAFWDTYQDRVSVLRLRAAERVSTRPRDAGRPLEFYVTLVEPKEAQEYAESIPEEHKWDLSLFRWECEYRLDVPVPRPLCLPGRTAESP